MESRYSGIINYLPSPSKPFVTGNCNKNAQPIRAKSSKWHVSRKQYPVENYPGVCYVPAYLVSISAIPMLLQKFSMRFWIWPVLMSNCSTKWGRKFIDTAQEDSVDVRINYHTINTFFTDILIYISQPGLMEEIYCPNTLFYIAFCLYCKMSHSVFKWVGNMLPWHTVNLGQEDTQWFKWSL